MTRRLLNRMYEDYYLSLPEVKTVNQITSKIFDIYPPDEALQVYLNFINGLYKSRKEYLRITNKRAETVNPDILTMIAHESYSEVI